MVKLGDIFDFKNGRAFKKEEWNVVGLPIVRIQNLNDFKASYNYFNGQYDKAIEINEGDLLFSWSGTVGTSFGPHLWSRERGLLNQHIYKLNFNKNILKEYAYYALLAITKEIEKSVNGAVGLVHVTKKSLNEFRIPLPAIPTQQKIVAKLDAIFAEIDKATAAAEANVKNAEALFESTLHLFFNTKNDWNENLKPLSELCELIVDCEHKTAPTQDEGFPLIRTPNIGKGKLLLDNVYRVSEQTYTEWTRRAAPRGGDIILAREAPAGNVAVIPENLKVCLGQRTVLIRPKSNILLSNFLAFMLLQPDIQAKLLAHSRGATVQHVNMKDIRALKIGSIPSLPVQNEIISILHVVINQAEALQLNYHEKLTGLIKLKNSILKQAFNGELVKE